MQGLLELLWTVYSERKLQACLKLRNFQNPLKDDSDYLAFKETTWSLMWLNLHGSEAVRHKLQNRQKLHFLCF